MGMKGTIPGRNSFETREVAHSTSRSAIHRAKVTEVHIDKGTVSLSFESIPLTAEATFPLLGLSAPVEGDAANFFNSSWGRYIPQVGDVVLAGFAPNMDIHILGYSAIYYKGFRIKDEDAEGEGGIGWGTVANKQLKPGDWDFRSARGSVLYLGDRANIGSGTCRSTYNQNTEDITNSAFLIINEANASDIRYGSVRRLVLPTDSEESYIPSARAGTPCQEFTAATRWDPGTGGVDLAYYSQGDVVEELGGSNTIKLSSNGLPVRKWAYTTDVTGFITTHEEVIDTNGNTDIQANLATSVSYLTPLADWSITAKSSSHTLIDSFEVTAGKSASFTVTDSFDVTAGTSVSISTGGSVTINNAIGTIEISSTGTVTINGNLEVLP